jgi:CheY-like chemotaxis protein
LANQPTILIVDDDPAIRKMMVEVLNLEGYPTETAENGRVALELLAHSGPRVVVLDLLMPEVDGWGVMRALEENPNERARHRVILVSALQYLETAQDLRVDGKLVKPFTVEQLLSVVAPTSAST